MLWSSSSPLRYVPFAIHVKPGSKYVKVSAAEKSAQSAQQWFVRGEQHYSLMVLCTRPTLPSLS